MVALWRIVSSISRTMTQERLLIYDEHATSIRYLSETDLVDANLDPRHGLALCTFHAWSHTIKLTTFSLCCIVCIEGVWYAGKISTE